MSTKMKGLLKGLRYISQIFDENNKEPEMQIGHPTDVKHVAHIGWDGPSVNSPSWMHNFRSGPEYSSEPLGISTDAKENSSVKWVSEDSTHSSRRSTRAPDSPSKDLPELPRTSRRQSSLTDSPSKEKSDRPRHSRRNQSGGRTKDSPDNTKLTSIQTLPDSTLGNDGSPSHRGVLPNIPKKTRRKKSKESSVGGSTRSSRTSKGNNLASSSSTYTSPYSDPGSGSVSKLGNNEFCQSSSPNLQPFEDGEKAIAGIS